MNTKVKESRSKSKYNPALDKFENSDLFKAQTELIAKKFKGRNLVEEIKAIKEKEKILLELQQILSLVLEEQLKLSGTI